MTPRGAMAVRTALFIVAVVLGIAGLAGCGGGNGREAATTSAAEPTPTPSITEPTPSPSPEPAPTPSAGELAASVVQIVALDESGSPVWSGSGTVVSQEGFILTNAHVVDDRAGEYAKLGVAITGETDQAPEPAFIARIAAVDYVLDLAVIEVISDLDGGPAQFDLPAIALGDSEAVEIGDHIRILGFPGIGGETITFTEGAVSGFTAQRDIADRAWIKTDATIAGGNSGGLAANEDGEIIGLPTISGSSEDQTELVDCRFVVDTNHDAVVDERDTCVPVGGFINGLRPIALALPLIDAAESAQAYISPYGEGSGEMPVAFDTENVVFSDLAFSPDVTEDDLPTEVVQTAPEGAPALCVFWDYEGMLDGVKWEALWFVDGELNEAGSMTDETWTGGEVGNWWVCTTAENGLRAGLYEVVLSVESEHQTSDAIYVGGDHPLVELSVENRSATPICFAHLSPSEASNWGQDELGADETIGSGESRVFTIPASVYDLLLRDCDLNVLAEEYELELTTDSVYTFE